MLLIKEVSLLHSPALLSFWGMRPPAHKYMYLYYSMGKGIQISIYVLNWKIHFFGQIEILFFFKIVCTYNSATHA